MSEPSMLTLPPGWEEARLGLLGEYINGRGFKKTEWKKSGRPIIRIQDLTGSNSHPNFFDGVVDNKHVVKPGDLLVSWAATLGAYIWRGPEGVLNQHIFKVQTFIDKRFHHLLVQHVLADMVKRSHGTGMVHITKGEFDRTITVVPPLPEQARIADAVDELFSDLDAGMAALERVRAKLKLYRASVLKAAVEGALTAEWRAQHPHTEPASELLRRILAERRHRWEQDQLAKFKAKGQEPPHSWKSKYKEPVAPDTTGFPSLPEGWCWATLDQLGRLDRGRSKHRPRDATFLYGGPYPFIQTGDVKRARQYLREHSQTYSEAGLAQSRLWPTETLCITIAANIAETAILSYPACFPDSIVGIIFESPLVPVRYVELVIRSLKTRISAYAPATAQKNINNEILRRLAVPIPTLDEQGAIVEAAEDQLSVVDHLDDDLNAKLTSAQALRQTILRHAFTGQLVPQDPNDEPASELLKRIATEREARAHEGITAKRATRKTNAPRTGRRGRPRKHAAKGA